ncbi:hypothetical protein BLNAU_2965 [Blattamonas nauphoetae]|uniref:Uncharacterized protein n=1 Tax=Blattamonas nauphoetae TaxID=2049346 RepID=A0ABQ9YE98_9EUKA|nr:hypothetical protein BLNAU_2965 [Blattamonas nauphoetae]
MFNTPPARLQKQPEEGDETEESRGRREVQRIVKKVLARMVFGLEAMPFLVPGLSNVVGTQTDRSAPLPVCCLPLKDEWEFGTALLEVLVHGVVCFSPIAIVRSVEVGEEERGMTSQQAKTDLAFGLQQLTVQRLLFDSTRPISEREEAALSQILIGTQLPRVFVQQPEWTRTSAGEMEEGGGRGASGVASPHLAGSLEETVALVMMTADRNVMWGRVVAQSGIVGELLVSIVETTTWLTVCTQERLAGQQGRRVGGQEEEWRGRVAGWSSSVRGLLCLRRGPTRWSSWELARDALEWCRWGLWALLMFVSGFDDAVFEGCGAEEGRRAVWEELRRAERTVGFGAEGWRLPMPVVEMVGILSLVSHQLLFVASSGWEEWGEVGWDAFRTSLTTLRRVSRMGRRGGGEWDGWIGGGGSGRDRRGIWVAERGNMEREMSEEENRDEDGDEDEWNEMEVRGKEQLKWRACSNEWEERNERERDEWMEGEMEKEKSRLWCLGDTCGEEEGRKREGVLEMGVEESGMGWLESAVEMEEEGEAGLFVNREERRGEFRWLREEWGERVMMCEGMVGCLCERLVGRMLEEGGEGRELRVEMVVRGLHVLREAEEEWEGVMGSGVLEALLLSMEREGKEESSENNQTSSEEAKEKERKKESGTLQILRALLRFELAGLVKMEEGREENEKRVERKEEREQHDRVVKVTRLILRQMGVRWEEEESRREGPRWGVVMEGGEGLGGVEEEEKEVMVEVARTSRVRKGLAERLLGLMDVRDRVLS